MSELPERPRILYIDLDLEADFQDRGLRTVGERLLAILSFAPSPEWCQRFNRAGKKAGGYLGAAEIVGSTVRFLALQHRSRTAVAQLACLVDEVKVIHGRDGRPRTWRELSHEIQFHYRHVQDLKATARTHLAELADLAGRGDTFKARQSRVTNRLRSTLGQFARVSPEHVPPMLSALPEGDRLQVERLLPTPGTETTPAKPMTTPEPKPPEFQARRSVRPVP